VYKLHFTEEVGEADWIGASVLAGVRIFGS